MSPEDQDRLTAAPDGRPMEEQPRWRQDFPIDWPQDEYVSRRELVKFMTLTSLAFAAGQVWLVVREVASMPDGAWPRILVADLDEVPVGGAMVFNYPEASAPRLLVRIDETSFVAYEQQCTHLLCPVVPAVDEGELHCPCHHGVFDLATGRPLAGPPRRALARVDLEIRDGKVWATGMTKANEAVHDPSGDPDREARARSIAALPGRCRAPDDGRAPS